MLALSVKLWEELAILTLVMLRNFFNWLVLVSNLKCFVNILVLYFGNYVNLQVPLKLKMLLKYKFCRVASPPYTRRGMRSASPEFSPDRMRYPPEFSPPRSIKSMRFINDLCVCST